MGPRPRGRPDAETYPMPDDPRRDATATTPPPPLTADPREVERALRVLFAPGDVFEIRAPKCKPRGWRGKAFPVAGWFDDFPLAAAAVQALDARGKCEGIYVTLNPCNAQLLARGAGPNRLEDYAERTTTDSPDEILRRRWLLIDLDPSRVTGISSTQAELVASIETAKAIRLFLETEHGFPEPVRALSGNGAHLLYRIDLSNDENSTLLVKQILQALTTITVEGVERVDVDTSVFNGSRIDKLYGTVARKGAHTADRPHRLARIEAAPDPIAVVPIEKLRAVATLAPSPKSKAGGSTVTPSPSELPPMDVRVRRASKYLSKVPPAVEGQHGSDTTFSAAVALVQGFALPPDVALDLLVREHNPICQPPWSEAELRHKVDDAARKTDKPLGYMYAGDAVRKTARRRRAPGATETPTVTEADLDAADGGRPTIDTTDRDLPAMVEEVQALLLGRCVGTSTSPDIELWQRTGLLVRVVRDSASSRGIVRPAGAPSIATVPRGHLRELASRVAAWLEMRGQGGRQRMESIYPPDAVLAALEDRGSWPFSHLEGVVETPTLRPDGTIIDRAGYDAASALLYEAGGLAYPAVPARPTADDVRQALNLVREPFADVPFVAEVDAAAALAALLTVPTRHLIGGPLPMFAVRAPVRGSGKTLIADVIATMWTGRRAARCMYAEDDAEMRKRLHALCIAGDPIVLLDNVERPLQSGVLAAALTSREIRDRLLGVTRMVTAPMDGLWLVTGNNLSVRGDLSRRIVPIDIDPRTEHPEERQGFRHPDLIGWVRELRPQLVSAALTLIRAWWIAGRPQPPGLAPYGSYEAWCALVRACVVWLGLPDPIGARDRIRSDGDLEVEVIGGALSAWEAALGVGRAYSTADVIAWIRVREEVTSEEGNRARDLREALLALLPGAQHDLSARRLGVALRRHRGRIVAGLSWEGGGHGMHGVPWRVVRHDHDDGDDHDDAPSRLSLACVHAPAREAVRPEGQSLSSASSCGDDGSRAEPCTRRT